MPASQPVRLSDLEVVVAKKYPLLPDPLVAALVLYFIETHKPIRFEDDEGVLVDNVAGLSTAEAMDDCDRAYVAELGRRAEGEIDPERLDDLNQTMFGPKLGFWTVSSESDPRWNGSGRGPGLVILGGPPGIMAWVKECRERYGEPPADLTSSFMKD